MTGRMQRATIGACSGVLLLCTAFAGAVSWLCDCTTPLVRIAASKSG
jgi:hypothetical protein